MPKVCFIQVLPIMGRHYDSGFSVCEVVDGGYILAGSTIPEGESYSDVFLVKTDVDGNVEWSESYGGSDAEYGFSVDVTDDDGFVVAGYVYDYGVNNGQVLLLKVDSLGDQEWMTSIGGPEIDEGFSVQETSDDGFIIAGFSDSFSRGRDVYLVKTDSSGKMEWQETFSGTGASIGYCARETSEGGFVVVGSTDVSGNNEVWLIKTDVNGSKEWDRRYGGLEGDWANSVRQTSDGGYVLAGTTLSHGAGGQDVWLIKTDSVGIIDWDETFGGTGSERGEEVVETGDGGFVVVGFTDSFGDGGEDVYLIKTDGGGSVLWEMTIGGPLNDLGHSVFLTSDGDFIVAGETLSYGSADSFDAWLIEVRWGNDPPDKPSRPSGPLNGKVGDRIPYTSEAVDPDGDQVLLLFDWGDGKDSGWLGPFDSGETVEAKHTWTQKGTFQIKVKAMDVHGAEGVWSDPLPVRMPRGSFVGSLFLDFLRCHPNLFLLLEFLLGV